MKRLISVVVVSTLATVALTACAPGNTVVPNSHVTVAEIGAISTLNSDVQSSAVNKISSDISQLTSQDFYVVDKNGDLVANKPFGSVQVTNKSPFTVTYTFGKSAVWSDGSTLDSTDLALAVYAAKDSKFNSIHYGSSLSQAVIVGTPNPGDNSLTLQFPKPVADWKTVLDVRVPAHVVGKTAGLGGNVAAVRAGVLSAIVKTQKSVLKGLAGAYSSAFTPTADATNFLSDGAYSITKVSPDQVSLKAVRDFGGTHKGIADNVNVKIFADNATAFKQVNAGSVDVFAPTVTLNEPQADLVSQSQSLSTKKVTVLAPSSSMVEQFVINLSAGALADSSYRNPKTALVLRQAVLNIFPKARAIDFASMTQSVSKSDSFVYSAGSKNYSAVVSQNGSSNFVLQDSEKSSELVAGLKLKSVPVLRVLFDSNDPAAVAEWTLMSDHASASGFKLLNISRPNPSARLRAGTYEIFLGAQPLLGVGKGSIQQLTSGPAQMPESKYLELTKAVVDSSNKGLSGALQDLDKKLFELGFGLPMYQLPTLLVYNNRVQGLSADPFGNNSTWGYWTWHVSADK